MQRLRAHAEPPRLLTRLDNAIERLSQMRGLLADPVVLAVVQGDTMTATAALRSGGREPNDCGAVRAARKRVQSMSDPFTEPRLQGAVLRTAYGCMQGMDEPFTVRDLADRMRTAGYTFKGNPKTSLRYPMRKFVLDGFLKRVEEGGGGGRHESTYQKNSGTRSATEPYDQSTRDHVPRAPTDPRLGSEMLRTASQCVEIINEPFTSHDLIQKMRIGGYTFVGDSSVSIQSALGKLLNMGVLEVAEAGAGRRPRLYRRRNAEPLEGSDLLRT